MKISLFLIACMLFGVYTAPLSATSINGRFVVQNVNEGRLIVLLQINTNTGTDDLGGSTMIVQFNHNSLNFNSSPQVNTDYIFHNFNGGTYSNATITKPSVDKLWLNIDLPFNNSNNGTVVSGNNGWTDVATLIFNIVNPADTLKLNWLTASPYWAVYDANNVSTWSTGTFQNLQYIINPDVTPPEVTGITVTSNNSLTVNFSEKLNPLTANDKNNYAISDNIGVLSTQLLPDSSQVRLKTTGHSSNVIYNLTVSNIKDRAGNVQSPNPSVISYSVPKRIKGYAFRYIINNAVAATQEENFTTNKMIDGSGMNSPMSRWQSTTLMPDTITFDLEENVSLDSIRISFYKGESGRIYKYSLYSSVDLNEWSTIIEKIWSDEDEWTDIAFDSTSGRFIKLVLHESNQNSKASIWEFESYGITQTKKMQGPLTPETFALSQNYPNPFNPGTKIKWQSPVDGHQTLRVYDVLGNEVALLVNEYRSAGYYEVNFDAAGLASGIYLYRLQIDNFVQTKKMILVH